MAPLSLADAELVLVCTTRFEFGVMPPKRQAQAFNLMFDQADAVRRFEAVAAAAGPVGRLYALAAFDMLSLPNAERTAADLARDDRLIYVQETDLVLKKRASELVQLVRQRRIGSEFRRERLAIAAYYDHAR